MADKEIKIEYVEVKDTDIMAERREMYDGFMRAVPWAIGVTLGILVLIYLIWG